MPDTRNFYAEFMQLVQNGDEAAARKFLTDNFEQFPEEVREEITYAFFVEAISKRTEEIGITKGIQKRGTDALKVLQTATTDLEEQKRIDELKEGLSQ